jgi:hypothetical protein
MPGAASRPSAGAVLSGSTEFMKAPVRDLPSIRRIDIHSPCEILAHRGVLLPNLMIYELWGLTVDQASTGPLCSHFNAVFFEG